MQIIFKIPSFISVYSKNNFIVFNYQDLEKTYYFPFKWKKCLNGILIDVPAQKLNIFKTHLNILKKDLLSFQITFQREINLVGIGYRVFYDKEKNKLEFKLGFSHPVYVTVPSGILVRWLKPTKLILKSKNYQQLTQFLAFLRSFRKIDVYKGKGILFKNEKVSLKQGKKS